MFSCEFSKFLKTPLHIYRKPLVAASDMKQKDYYKIIWTFRNLKTYALTENIFFLALDLVNHKCQLQNFWSTWAKILSANYFCEFTEATARRCSVEQGFRKISQDSPKIICARVWERQAQAVGRVEVPGDLVTFTEKILMENFIFCAVVSLKPLTIFTKSSALDVWLGSECACVYK